MRTSSKTQSSGAARFYVAPIVEACKLPLAKVGVHDTPPLGCGAYGCVYPGKPGEAVKVLRDDSEPEVAGARWLMALGARRPAELPRIYGVYRLQRCVPAKHWQPALSSTPPGAYVIVREEIRSTGIKNTDALQMALHTLERSGDSNDCNWVDTLGASLYHQLEDQFSDQARKDLLRAAWRLQVWACRNQVEISDTHPENWGRRANGDFVLRDFGHLYSRERGAGPEADTHKPTKLPAFGGLRGW